MPEDHPEHQLHNSHSLPHRASSSSSRPSLTSVPSGPSSTGADFFHSQTPPNQPNWIACLAGLVCIISLFLPTEGEPSEAFKDYSWLHLTVNQKLVFAYVLGLVTMVILRTTWYHGSGVLFYSSHRFVRLILYMILLLCTAKYTFLLCDIWVAETTSWTLHFVSVSSP